ncbi:2-dehydropantoate 2-reductase [Priestia flexa]|uniref:2-dehydropantoate 2-reductase n=1 Tax=Priestia flexa TaxID=86664 RepID=UPI002492B015|nr:2-dehydropantoate 2-reductase [Priestia flexa]
MRILVLGAGGVGGYFGGRLAEKGEDVTFLVRSQRKKQLEKSGLVIKSIHGDYSFSPKLITATSEGVHPFDCVLFSTKAYHLDQAIADVKPFVGSDTTVIPLLNGIDHLSTLQRAFGEDNVIGGLCFIETTLNADGEIIQTSPAHRVVYGEFNGEKTNRIERLETAFSYTKTSFVLSDCIEQEMWHKYLFITTLSGVTTLMRSPIGPIRDVEGGRTFIQSLLQEVYEIMVREGASVSDGIVQQHMKTMESMTYTMKSSMQRDIEKGYMTEAEHLQGYLLRLAQKYDVKSDILHIVYQHLKVYEKVQKGTDNQ